jgi:hypothetical protein
MKFGVFSLMQWPEDRSQSDVYRNELAQLSEAEAQGYDGIWLAEHHFSRYGIGPAIHLTAAHLAARTENVFASERRSRSFPSCTRSVSPRRSRCWITYPGVGSTSAWGAAISATSSTASV